MSRGSGSGSGSRYQRTPNASLFVRGLNLQSTADDLKDLFSRYGAVRDVYIPQDYHTREPRGFCYVEFEDVRDAEDALHYLDGTRLHGRELEIQYAEGDRKTPHQMRGKERGGGGRRHSRSTSPRRRRGRNSRSPSRSRSPRRRSHSQSPSSVHSRHRRRHSQSYSRSLSRSPVGRRGNHHSPSPSSPSRKSRGSHRSPSPRRRSHSRSCSRSPSRSRSYSQSPS